MGLSRQMMCTLAIAAAIATVVPGAAGYLSARVEMLARAEQDLAARVKAANDAGLLRQALVPVPPSCTPGDG